MGRDPAEQATPDLFSTNTVGDASPPRPKRGGTEAATETARQRHILPKNLRTAVKHLSDGELDLMHAATLEEMKRRGRKPPGVETDLQTLRHRLNVRPGLTKIKSPLTEKRRHEGNAQVSLTRGQVNAVRSAFKAADSLGFPNRMCGRRWRRMSRRGERRLLDLLQQRLVYAMT
jgi:hypothetical protein